MKDKLKFLFALLFLGAVITSCEKKDEDDKDGGGESKTNYFMVGDVEYSLSKGVLENYGQATDSDWDHEGYNIDLYLVSDGISLTQDSDGNIDASGVGNLLYFEMFTSEMDKLEDGEYMFDENSLAVKTFDYSSYALSYNVNSDDESEEDKWVDIASGKVTVKKAGSEYTIDIACKDEDGKNIVGNYKGTLLYSDVSEDRKSAEINTNKRFVRK